MLNPSTRKPTLTIGKKKDPSDRGLKGARGLVSASGVDVFSIDQLGPPVKRIRAEASQQR